MSVLDSLSPREKNALVSAANGLSIDISEDEMFESGILCAVAAHLAVEESWGEKESLAVLTQSQRHIGDPDSDIAAATAISGATLETWWVRDRSSPTEWARALEWSNLAVHLRPNWVAGWVLLVDGYLFEDKPESPSKPQCSCPRTFSCPTESASLNGLLRSFSREEWAGQRFRRHKC